MNPPKKPRRFFHRTTAERAERILRQGFRDGRGRYMTDAKLAGVFLSLDYTLDDEEGAHGDTAFEVLLPLCEEELDFYEIKQEAPYREFLIPASVINGNAKIRLIDDPPSRWDFISQGNDSQV